MDHHDHVNLLKPAELEPGASWADLGAGTGAFTFALREVIGPAASIHAVDKDRSSLKELEQGYLARFGSTDHLHIHIGDLSRVDSLPLLDGILMANSLHYFKDKTRVLRHLKTFLKPNGKLLVVEYNVDSGNPWVPYPFSFGTFGKLATQAGFAEPRLLATHPSRFLREFYSGLTHRID